MISLVKRLVALDDLTSKNEIKKKELEANQKLELKNKNEVRALLNSLSEEDKKKVEKEVKKQTKKQLTDYFFDNTKKV